MNKLLREIAGTNVWAMDATALAFYRDTILRNIESNIKVEFEKSEQKSYPLGVGKSFDPVSRNFIGDYDRVEYYNSLDETDRVINVVNVSGPITRNGGACSYGSVYFRDQIIRAANAPQTIGHIICINTPGGSANAGPDFKNAIEYAHSKGQKVYGLIDGEAYSAGCYLASLCDKVYYITPESEIGCIGVLWSSYTQKHGDKNTIDNSVYVERYSSLSPDKNREYRDACEGNYEAIDAVLDKYAKEFIEIVRAGRPGVKDEQLTGKTYRASEVEGSLVDGQRSLMQLADEIFNSHAQSSAKSAQSNHTPTSSITNQNPINMNHLDQLNAAFGLKEPVTADADNGIYLNADQLVEVAENLAATTHSAEELNAQLTAAKESATQAQTQLSEAQTRISEMQTEAESHTAQIEAIHSDHQQAVDQLNQQHADAIEALTSDHKKAIDDLNAAHHQAIESLNQRIEELNAENAELSNRAPKETEAGGAPETNVPATRTVLQPPKWDPSKTALENKKAADEYKNELNQRIKNNN